MKFIGLFSAVFCAVYFFGYFTGWRVVAFVKAKGTAARVWFANLSVVRWFKERNI